MSEVNFKILKNYHRENRHKFKESFSIRIHRSLSWIQRAEREKEDKDASFIFYWIAFNAAYSERKSIKMQKNERSNFSSFFHSLIECDVEKIIYKALWNEFANSIRVLLNNHYIYDPYWSFINGDENYKDWKENFEKSKKYVLKCLSNKDSFTILEILFDRLYTLRNQILHGSSTWNSDINRDQVNDGTKIISFLIPNFVSIMMLNYKQNWGSLAYPIIEA